MAKPKAVGYEQGTEEWLRWRRQRYSASEASVVTGNVPRHYKTKSNDDLRRLKRDGETPPDNWTQRMFQHGHDWEPVAREVCTLLWAAPYGSIYRPRCLEDGKFAASLDGMLTPVGDWSTWTPESPPLWLEIKCPYTGRKSAKAKKTEPWLAAGQEPKKCIVDEDLDQMSHQAGVILGWALDNPREKVERAFKNVSAAYVIFIADKGMKPKAALRDMQEQSPVTALHNANTFLREKMLTVRIPVLDLLDDWENVKAGWERYEAGRAY